MMTQDVGADLAGRISKDKPHDSGLRAVEQEADRRHRQREEWSQLQDKFGRRFDPELHHHDATTGEPMLTQAGTLRMKRKGMKFRHTTPQAQDTLKPLASPEIDARDVATVTVDTITGICAMVLGDHWRAQSTEANPEYQTMVDAWTRYFKAEGITQIKPRYFLLLTMGGYVAPRISHPKTRERMKSWFSRRKSKLESWREHRRERRSAKGETRDDRGSGGDREDQPGRPSGPGILSPGDPGHRT